MPALFCLLWIALLQNKMIKPSLLQQVSTWRSWHQSLLANPFLRCSSLDVTSLIYFVISGKVQKGTHLQECTNRTFFQPHEIITKKGAIDPVSQNDQTGALSCSLISWRQQSSSLLNQFSGRNKIIPSTFLYINMYSCILFQVLCFHDLLHSNVSWGKLYYLPASWHCLFSYHKISHKQVPTHHTTLCHQGNVKLHGYLCTTSWPRAPGQRPKRVWLMIMSTLELINCYWGTTHHPSAKICVY